METFEDKIPRDYYARLAEVEESHWWHVGIRELQCVLLGDRFTTSRTLLDAGCGAGGFLRWAMRRGHFAQLAGTDISPTAIDFARGRVPVADLYVAPLTEIPLIDNAYDVLAINDVVQHVPEGDVHASLIELRRVLRPGGALLVRTNGAHRARAEGDDWRLYDAPSLARCLADAHFRVERLTYASFIPSLWAAVRGESPRAPTSSRHGLPRAAGRAHGAVGRATLAAERIALEHGSRRVPFGHTLLAVGVAD